MKSFATICAEAERDTREAINNEAKKFRPKVFKNWIQCLYVVFGSWLLRNLNGTGSIRRRLREKNEAWLDIIVKYQELIQEEYRNIKYFFDLWEEENRRDGCGTTKTRTLELGAIGNVESMTADAQRELDQAGYPYAPLRHDLYDTTEGWISVERGIRYWDGLEEFFVQRIKSLN